jgi:hypothetical protein
MSDAQGTAEQPAQEEQQAQRKWGDALDGLTQERKVKLADALWGWTAAQATAEQPGPFAGERLTGLQVYWLAACAVAGQDGETAAARLLVDANERVSIRVVHLPLAGAWLGDAQLASAYLRQGQLAGASLTSAQLTGAILPWAQLEGADLHGAQLEGADLSSAQVAGADLTGASLDKATRLNGATLTGVLLDQVILDNTNLTVVAWDHVPVLGDELRADEARDQVGGGTKRREGDAQDAPAACGGVRGRRARLSPAHGRAPKYGVG